MPSAAYLTPEQYEGPTAAGTVHDDAGATTSSASPTAAPVDDSTRKLFSEGLPNRTASPHQGPNSLKLLQKKQAGDAISSQMPDSNSAFAQPLDLLPVSNATPASPNKSLLEGDFQGADNGSAVLEQAEQQQHQPQQKSTQQHQHTRASSSRSPAESRQDAELSEASVRRIVDAVAERTLAQHKRMLSYLHDGHREMLRILKADISKEGKRLQAAIEAQVIGLLSVGHLQSPV